MIIIFFISFTCARKLTLPPPSTVTVDCARWTIFHEKRSNICIKQFIKQHNFLYQLTPHISIRYNSRGLFRMCGSRNIDHFLKHEKWNVLHLECDQLKILQKLQSPFYSVPSIFAVLRNLVWEIWFKKSGSRNLVQEKWLTRKKGGFIP